MSARENLHRIFGEPTPSPKTGKLNPKYLNRLLEDDQSEDFGELGRIGGMPDFKRVQGPDDVPEGSHFAVLVYHRNTVHIPGDERSRQAPGHGYPAHNETFDTFEHWVATSEEGIKELLVTLENPRYGEKKPFVVLRVEGKASLSFEPKLQW